MCVKVSLGLRVEENALRTCGLHVHNTDQLEVHVTCGCLVIDSGFIASRTGLIAQRKCRHNANAVTADTGGLT